MSGDWRRGLAADPGRRPAQRLAGGSARGSARFETSTPVIAAGRAEVGVRAAGHGRAQALPPRAVREALQAAGLGLEFMDSDAAARLYNVLTSEGRRFATALIAV